MSSNYFTYDSTTLTYETTSRMRATYTLNMWYQSPYMGHHTYSIDNITPNLFMTSHSPYVWHSLRYTRHHILTFFTSNHHFEDITPTILDIVSNVSVSSHQLYRWYHSHYMYDFTSSIWETNYPLYLWHHTNYVWQHKTVCWLHHTRHMYDIICATEDVTSTLSHQAKVFMTSNPLQAWYHTLYQISQQLYHCHHNLSTDITPTFYYITPTISVTS